MTMLVIAALAAASPAAAAPAAVQSSGPAVVDFAVGSVPMQARLLTGYCLPEGAAAVTAKRIAAADPRNVTHATAVSCNKDKAWSDYFIVKTPNELMNVDTNIAELQAAMGSALKQADLNAGVEEASKSLSKNMGSEVQVKGEVRGYGQDSRCIYLGAVMDLKAPERGIAYTLAMMGCMTVVGGRVVTIYHYAPGNSEAAVQALKPSVLAFAAGMRAKAPAKAPAGK